VHYEAFLTNQGKWLVIMYFFCAVVMSCAVLFNPPGYKFEDREGQGLARRLAVRWWQGWKLATHALQELAVVFEIVIVILYWLMLKPSGYSSVAARFRDFHSHGAHMALVTFDALVVSSSIFPDRHSIMILVATIGYLLWNLRETMRLGPVYPVLKWDDGASGILVVASILLTQGAFFAMQLCVALRDRAAKRLHASKWGPQKDLGASASASDAAWEAVFPLTFADDATVARPCYSCTCCSCCNGFCCAAATEAQPATQPALAGARTGSDKAAEGASVSPLQPQSQSQSPTAEGTAAAVEAV
jgi:hypothetical protein